MEERSAGSTRGALVSIIVPVYNVERELPRCLASIRAQTYKNLEIILVDDGSTDFCAQICDASAREDARVRVVHKQNGGLSSARNAGLEVATGEFVGFVDGDDQIEPEMVQRLLEILKKTGANIAFCGIIIDRDGVLFPMPLPEKFWKRNNYRLEGIDALAAMLRQDVNISVWNKLYTRSIIGGTRFDESAWVLEDMPFNFEVFGGGVSIVYLPEPMYRYIQRSSSLSRLGSNAAFKLAVRLKVLERLAEKSSNMPMAVRSAAREFCCRNVFHAVIRMGGARELRREVGALVRFAWREWGIGIVPPVAALACEMVAREAVRANARVRAKIAAARPRAKGR